MKRILLVSFLIFATKIFSQEVLFEKQLPEGFKVKRSFQITNTNSHESALFFVGNKSIFATLVDSNGNEVSSFDSPLFPTDYNIPLGASKKSDNIFQVYLTNRSKNTFGLMEFDFGTKSQSEKPIDLEFKKETFLQSFQYGGKLHILSILNKSSVLNFYVFDENGGASKNVVDLSSKKFRHWNNAIVDIYTLLTKPFGRPVADGLVKIDASTPNSLEISAAASKLFIEDNAIYLTFESNKNMTQVVRVDPNNFEHSTTTFNKPYIPNAPVWKKTNSFLFNGKYLGVTATNDLLKFEIKDYQTRELIKGYSIEKNKEIDFKNTPIGIQGSIYRKKTREIENENRFLRDLSDSEIGVSIYSEGNNYIVSLGSFEKIKTPIMIFPIPIAQIGFINITGFAYASIKTSRSTYFKSIFNSDFEHQKGEVPLTGFDFITQYAEELEDVKQEDVFKSKNVPVFGYLNKENKYSVVKF